jgi:hypothetical protein
VAFLPFEMADTLHAIEARLKKIEQTAAKMDECIDSDNHRHQRCVRTGHWNDSRH